MNLPDGATPDFPSEIVAEIFLRLPVKSLCRFKCASKPWRSLISNPNFAKKHFERNKKTQIQPAEKLFSISESLTCHTLDLESLKSSAVKLRSRFVETQITFNKIWNSCDGLLLLSELDSSLFLVNPSTGECRELPPSPFSIDSDETIDKCGFGYDSLIDDYKVVRISTSASHFEDGQNVVSIYNLRTNSWRRINSCHHKFWFPFLGDRIFMNRSLHWLGMENVLSLNLASESFQSTPLPRSPNGFKLLDGLNVIDCCLCVFVLGLKFWEPVDIWVMNEFGVGDSWVKTTVHCPLLKFILPLRTGKFLLCSRTNSLNFYDQREGKGENLTIGGNPNGAITYEESLIPLQEYDEIWRIN